MDDFTDRPRTSSLKSSLKKRVDKKRTTLWGEIERSLGIHGVRRIQPGKRSIFFSVLWCLVLLCALGMFVYALTTCVLKYLSYSVNIKMAVLESHRWPAITLCNLNPVRISQLAKNYWDSPGNPSMSRQQFEWRQFLEERTFISSREFFLHNSHTAADMIVNCDAGTIPCTTQNFTLAPTEDGLCHKITPDRELDSLELWLNAEAYEYIDGLAHSSGFKVYIHDQDDVPIRDDSHVYVFPGFNFELIVGIDVYQSLPQPYGMCLPSTAPIQRCLSQCYMSRINAQCGCMPFWYSTQNTGISECDIYKHFTCVKETLDTYHKHCRCIRGCSHTTYTTELEMYPNNLKSLEDFFPLQHNVTSVSKQYEKAQDIHSAVSESMRNKDNEIISRFLKAFQNGKLLLEQSERSLYEMKVKTNEELTDLQPRIHFHKDIALNGIKQTINKGYTEVWGKIELANLNKIAYDSREVMYKYDRSLKQLKYLSVTDMSSSRMFYTMGDSELSAKMDIAAESLENVTKLYYAYVNGEPNLDYEITPNKRYDLSLVPYSVLMSDSDYYQKYYNGISNGLGNYIQSIVVLKQMIRSTLTSRNYNETEKNMTRDAFLTHSTEIENAKNNFRKYVVERCERVIDDKISYIDSLNTSYLHSASELKSHIVSMESYLSALHLQVFSEMGHIINFSNSYLHHSNVSKAGLVYTFLDCDVTLLLHHIEKATIELLLQYRKLTTLLYNLQTDIILIWRTFFQEVLLRNFYVKLNNDVMQMMSNELKTDYLFNIFTHEKMLNEHFENKTGVLLERFLVLLNADIPMKDYDTKIMQINQTFTQVADIVKKADHFVICLKTLHSTLDKTDRYLREYEKGLHLGHNFAKKNLLKLKISKSPAHHLVWTQEVAYPLTALFVEIGVMSAVFLGASMLTYLEFCDILLAWLSEKFCPDNRPPPDVNKSFPTEYRNKYKPPESLNSSSRDPRDLDLNNTLNSNNRRSYVTFQDYNHISGSEV